LLTFRGISDKETISKLKNLKVGQSFTDEGFVSTSLDKKIAKNFSKGGIVVNIVNPAGTKGIFPIGFRTEVGKELAAGESEWLLPRNTKFYVTKIDGNEITVSLEAPSRRVERIQATVQDFVEATDGMNESDLFRIDAIRTAANPASMADIFATANKIEDKAARHAVKTDIVLWAQGDVKAAERLLQQSQTVAAKIGSLEDEIFEAKYFGQAIDSETGQLTMDLMNQGENAEKYDVLVAEYDNTLADIYKKLNVEATLTQPNYLKLTSGQYCVRKSHAHKNFIDIRSGCSIYPSTRYDRFLLQAS
jgi:hypothetical protein